MEPTNKKSNGALVGSVIIIILLVIGGVYLISNAKQGRFERSNVQDTGTGTAADTLSSSDDISDIEADLGTNAEFDSLDKDLE